VCDLARRAAVLAVLLFNQGGSKPVRLLNQCDSDCGFSWAETPDE